MGGFCRRCCWICRLMAVERKGTRGNIVLPPIDPGPMGKLFSGSDCLIGGGEVLHHCSGGMIAAISMLNMPAK